jgi:hypothetical protein
MLWCSYEQTKEPLMSTTITQPQPILRPAPRAIARVAPSDRWPWAHPGVASERGHRAERAYVGELTHAEHAARVRVARGAAR